MSENLDHNPGDHDDPLAGPTWTVAVAGTVFFAVSVLGVTALFYRTLADEHVTKVLDQATIEVEAVRSEQVQRLSDEPRRELRPENPDREESLVIPLDHAIQLVVQEAKSSS